MRVIKDLLWTWLLPERSQYIDEKEWIRKGGKWIIFDRKDRIIRLAERLGPYIDSGQIRSAKYWNKDPSAICVYSFDYEKGYILEILQKLGAGGQRVWEYDYAWDKNIARPFDFVYSWYSKFRTILQSYGIIGSLRLIRDILQRE
ncbi:MAG: hypothetical protein ACK415_11030 [Thermodesulfovibrionales bacterium]